MSPFPFSKKTNYACLWSKMILLHRVSGFSGVMHHFCECLKMYLFNF